MSKIVGLLKQGWNEIPEIMGSSFMALVGIGMAFLSMRIYDKKGGDNKRYVHEYTVVRHDDPRAKFVRKD